MTHEEQDQITGRVVRELAETKRRLACLEAKAEALSHEFGLLANWLSGRFPSGVNLAEGLSVPEALSLVEAIKETRKRVGNLEARRAELGV